MSAGASRRGWDAGWGCGKDWMAGTTSESDLALLSDCWTGGGVGEGALGELADWYDDEGNMADLEGARAEVEGVKRPWARPWLRRRRAEPGIMEAEGRTDWGYIGAEKEDAADIGRGEGAVVAAGREVREDEEGVKSKRGARRGATPYWAAMSRPRSSGILANE